jgi:hypothetical protein
VRINPFKTISPIVNVSSERLRDVYGKYLPVLQEK